MRINDGMFCFAHLQSCHNGWACNILIVVDAGKAGIYHSPLFIVFIVLEIVITLEPLD